MKDEDILTVAREVWLAILLQKFSATGESFYPAPHNEQAIIDFARRILAAAIPEGMVLVPNEPTEAMIDAAEKLDWANNDVRGNCCNQWQAMIAAATEDK
jgi:hypothetical protein